MELAVYVLCACPELYLNEIKSYSPKSPQDSWPKLIKRATEVNDDGHAVKTIRALIHGQQACKEFEESGNFSVKGDMWMQIAHMCKSVFVVEIKDRKVG